MSHFTYKSLDEIDRTSLCQGDVLKMTDELKTAMDTIHPYFNNGNYKYFIVITQSCDLVRRNGTTCKSPYITLAAIRSLDDFFKKELVRSKDYKDIFNDIVLLDDKKVNRYYQISERLYNNTETDYFFLYKDEEFDFNESMVAFLKVSIALKSELHYDNCLKAKILELSDEFKAKLGWLVGNIYSRVGTTDWTSVCTERERKKRFQDEINSRFVIADSRKLTILQKELENNGQHYSSKDDVIRYLDGIEIKTSYEEFLDCIAREVEKFDGFLSDDDKERFVVSIKNNAKIKQLIKK